MVEISSSYELISWRFFSFIKLRFLMCSNKILVYKALKIAWNCKQFVLFQKSSLWTTGNFIVSESSSFQVTFFVCLGEIANNLAPPLRILHLYPIRVCIPYNGSINCGVVEWSYFQLIGKLNRNLENQCLLVWQCSFPNEAISEWHF